jgi:hypothetical protein
MNFFLGQVGSEAAARVIQDAFNLSEETRSSWQKTWGFALSTDGNTLWVASVNFSLGIAAFALLYLAIQEGNEILKSQSWGKLVDIVVWPFIVVFMLGNNGFILANLVLAVRGIGQFFINGILVTSLGGVTMQDAIKNVNLNAVLIARIRQIYSDCDGLVGNPLKSCFEEKAQEAQAIVDSTQAGFPGFDASGAIGFINNISLDILGLISPTARVGAELGNAAAQGLATNGIEGAYTSVLQTTALPIIQFLLYAAQWVAVNLSEAALILTALFAPIALALSLMPIAGRMIFAWLAGFIGIMAYQLGYNLLIGLLAFMIVNMEGAAETTSGIGFLLFAATGAPWIAFEIGRGGGTALYQGLSRRAAAIGEGITSALSLAVKVFA